MVKFSTRLKRLLSFLSFAYYWSFDLKSCFNISVLTIHYDLYNSIIGRTIPVNSSIIRLFSEIRLLKHVHHAVSFICVLWLHYSCSEEVIRYPLQGALMNFTTFRNDKADNIVLQSYGVLWSFEFMRIPTARGPHSTILVSLVSQYKAVIDVSLASVPCVVVSYLKGNEFVENHKKCFVWKFQK